jgi:hypothetical protein
MAKSQILTVLMQRDGYTREEAEVVLQEARQQVQDGADPEELLYEEFGLEPDYIWELI